MVKSDVDLAICAFSGAPALWIMRWSPRTSTLRVLSASLDVEKAFTAVAVPGTRTILLSPLTDSGEIFVLRRRESFESPDIVVQDWASLAGVKTPCRLRVASQSRTLVIAGYRSGTVSTLALTRGGLIDGELYTVSFSGSGPDAARQDQAYIHDVLVVDGTIFATDLGSDVLRVVNLKSGEVGSPIACPPGSGPRHLADAGDGRLVVSGELDSTLMLFCQDAGALHLVDVVDATSAKSTIRNFPSSVAADPKSGLVYLANRGADTILTAVIEGKRLRVIAEALSGGVRPEHMVLVDNHLVVVHSVDGAVTALCLVDGVVSGEMCARATVPGAIWVEALDSPGSSFAPLERLLQFLPLRFREVRRIPTRYARVRHAQGRKHRA